MPACSRSCGQTCLRLPDKQGIHDAKFSLRMSIFNSLLGPASLGSIDLPEARQH